jgi:hypothetical protein
MKSTEWNTYRTTGYTHDVTGDSPRSTGGVHLHQVRKAKSGWQKRIMQSNGNHSASGPVTAISAAEGEAYFATAMKD